MVWSDFIAQPVIAPGDLKSAFLSQASPVQNTWYEVLNLSSSGALHHIRALRTASGGEDDPASTEIRVTIDGGTAQVHVRDNQFLDEVPSEGTSADESRMEVHANTRFVTSLLVEVRTTEASVTTLLGKCQYSEDQ